MYENKPEFLGGGGGGGGVGGGVQNKKPSVGGVWIFSGTAQYANVKLLIKNYVITNFPLKQN